MLCQEVPLFFGPHSKMQRPAVSASSNTRHARTCSAFPVCRFDRVSKQHQLQHRLVQVHQAAHVASSPVSTSGSDKQIVDKLLASIAGTDGGLNLSDEQKQAIDSMLDALDRPNQQPRPLKNPLLFGNYEVAYTSTSRALDQQGNPAGGRFRNPFGRLLFRSTGIFQSVLEPDIATNKIEFNLLGLLPGAVGLRGRVVPVGSNDDTVKVLFDPPVLSLGQLHLRIGPPSSVELTTQYLDERIRLGRGSRGSLFVFTRGGAADAAGMDQVGLQPSSKAAVFAFSIAFCSIFVAGALCWAAGPLAAKAAAVALWALGTAIGGIVRRGGIVLERKEVSAQAGQQSGAAGAAKAASS